MKEDYGMRQKESLFVLHGTVFDIWGKFAKKRLAMAGCQDVLLGCGVDKTMIMGSA